MKPSGPPPPLRAAVLVGGCSTRMGRPKAWLDHGHGPHALHLVRLLQALPEVQEVLLSGPLPPNAPAGISEIPHCPDQVSGIGPVGALLGLFAQHPATVPVSPDGRHETVLAIYEPSLRPLLEQMWGESRKSLQRQFSHWFIQTPQVPDVLAGQLVNVNTPEELSQVQPQLSSTS